MVSVEALTQWVALIAGAQFFMAGCIHVFWSDGGKYRVAGFDVKRFDDYTHRVLMFLCAVEGSPQLVRGAAMVASTFLFPEFSGAIIIYDALDGLALWFLGGYFFGGVKPLPSPPRGEDGAVPGSKLHFVKTMVTGAIGSLWLAAGRPVAAPLGLWALPIPVVQVTCMILLFNSKFPLPQEAVPIVNAYQLNKNNGKAYRFFKQDSRYQ
eukprot:CAMPEP_0119259628 /NCGR_PEP_ID=MMETSP1329-20130426/369_1 /TAXON_ID=114041 /ORGANISM="Genus nov. species nov., Strain RCC1024" /LENGTH=208 /DNA_ID=CAMNT_0007259021 /DNA_START=58 /DNA_END=684 /DNA_ORIENTATION=+